MTIGQCEFFMYYRLVVENIKLFAGCFPIWYFAGNDECGGSNQVAVALVISRIPLEKDRKK